MTNKEIFDDFKSKYQITVSDYRPLCVGVELVEDMQGITIWTGEGDVILYFPKRKTGTWVSVGCVVPDIANVPMIKCSVCGHLEPDVDAARTPYCSHCGSRMRGVPEDV